MDVTDVRLAAPTANGFCDNDRLTFSQDTKWTQVCGITEDTHFYLDVDPAASSTLDFTFVTDSTNFDRRWRIKVSQICCDQISMAPSGCGQYFTSTTGTIKGWNSQPAEPANTYLAGQNYAICMRKEINRCSTTYLDRGTNIFFPVCGDTLEWPFSFLPGTPVPTCGGGFIMSVSQQLIWS
ncbi:hypothetical protein SK128_013326 [Halocaridina rubra]|uniref:CUB domain-containing protein n=1 Tax=Halocaridina rubra TaxID=373956 RepID=A0AAN8XEZ3_HALRR